MPTPMTPMGISTHDKHTPVGMNTHTHDGGCTPTPMMVGAHPQWVWVWVSSQIPMGTPTPFPMPTL